MGKQQAIMVAKHDVKSFDGITYQTISVDVEYPTSVWDDPLKGLRVHAQQDSQRDEPWRTGALYGHQVGFRYGWGSLVQASDAARMGKVLRGIEASLARQQAKHGDPLDFAQFVLRVAEALRISTIEVEGGYSTSLAGAADQIRAWEREFKARFDPAA